MVSFSTFLAAALSALLAAVPGLYASSIAGRESVNSGKRGAAYDDASTVFALNGPSPPTWAYSWSAFDNGLVPSRVEFVPMVRNNTMQNGWSVAIENALQQGSHYVLGFNEPDIPSQVSLTPEQAAQYYWQLITPFSGKAKLVSPAISNVHGPATGLNWMRSFLRLCADCNVSVLAIRWYGDTPDDFKKFVFQAIDIAAQHALQSVWVTEFALNNDLRDRRSSLSSVRFLQEVLPWLDSQDRIGRNAYFKCSEDYLIRGNGLTSTGKVYTS